MVDHIEFRWKFSLRLLVQVRQQNNCECCSAEKINSWIQLFYKSDEMIVVH